MVNTLVLFYNSAFTVLTMHYQDKFKTGLEYSKSHSVRVFALGLYTKEPPEYFTSFPSPSVYTQALVNEWRVSQDITPFRLLLSPLEKQLRNGVNI